jgi:hypothetical protein
MGMPDVISIGNASPLKGAAMTSPSEEYRLIPLTQGQFSIVDAVDFDWLSQWKWCARWSKGAQSFYAIRKGLQGETVLMHRVILGLDKGNAMHGDHINHNTLDNRRSNLRAVNRSQNMCNRKIHRNNTTGFKGVTFMKDRNLYVARIRKDGALKVLGYRSTAESAHLELYVPASEKYHGQYGRTK